MKDQMDYFVGGLTETSQLTQKLLYYHQTLLDFLTDEKVISGQNF